MSLRPRARLRAVAASSIVAVAAGSAVVLGTAQPASAVPLSFDCNVPILGAQTFTVDITSTAPAQLPTGSTTTPDITAAMTIPSGMADTMRSLLGATSMSGTIGSTALVDGVEQVLTLTVPPTPLGSSGSAQMAATGPMAPVTAGAPGTTIPLAAGDQNVVMNLFDASNQSVGQFTIPCTPSSGQDTALSSIAVVKDGSSTTAKASYSAKRDRATGIATVSSAHGVVAPTGTVKFLLKRGTQKVASLTKALSGGKATAVFTGVRRSGRYTIVATYPGSNLLNGSRGSARFSVR